jgi:hypothetical protein
MPSRNELLADHYLKAADIGAICIDVDGSVTMYETVGVKIPTGMVILCCRSGDISQLAALARACRGDQAAVAVQLEQLAGDLGIGLSPHAVVVDRALAAVEAVNTTIDHMQRTGGMREFNAMFKTARSVAPSLRYHDYLHGRKAEMLEAMAREIR